MRIPKLEFKQTSTIDEKTWQDIVELASGELTSTDGLIEALQARERIAIYRHNEEIIGLAAIDLRPETFNGRKVCAIYTGNTWIRKDWRNANLIQLLAFISMLEAKRTNPLHKMYWFFGSNNYMSYRLLYRNFDTYWPKQGVSTPTWERSYMEHLGEVYFPGLDKASLIWSQPSSRAFKDDTKLSEKQRQDPNIQYYLGLNPDFVRGNRLMCMAPLDAKSISKVVLLVGKRMWKRLKG